MSIDFLVTNKPCDHILRGIPCFVSNVDCKTLLPRNDCSQYLFSNPVSAGVANLKLYNQWKHTFLDIPISDPLRGWSMEVQPIFEGNPELGTALMVRFKQRQPTNQGIWKLSYQVTGLSCLKCQGTNVLTDLTLLGDPDEAYYVQYEAKLAQDFLKFLLTPIGSDPYYKWIGTSMTDLVGNKFNARDVENLLTQQVQNAATAIQGLQTQQATIQQVDPREMLSSVSSLTVQQDTNDPRQLLMNIQLTTNSRTLSNIQVPFNNG